MDTAATRRTLRVIFGSDAAEAAMDTAQELGSVALRSSTGNVVKLTVDDEEQCWYLEVSTPLADWSDDRSIAQSIAAMTEVAAALTAQAATD